MDDFVALYPDEEMFKDLDPEIFIYQPVDDPSTALFYDHNNEKVKQWYRKYRETSLYGSSVENLRKWWITEFEDWQSPKGVRQIPVMEYPLAANYSYFMHSVQGCFWWQKHRKTTDTPTFTSN